MSRHKVLLIFAVVSAILLNLSCPAGALWQPYEYLVTIETKEFPDQLRYAGCNIRPLIKAYIKRAEADGSNESRYETLWFCKGKLFGLERVGSLNVPRGSSIGIKVVHLTKTPSDYEFACAAESILRIYVDGRLNNDAIPTVTVPDESFASIVSALGEEHFQVVSVALEVPVQISAGMFLRDESGQHVTNMCYAPNSYGY